MDYVVPTAPYIITREVTLSNVSTSAFSTGDIITNDKEGLNNCLSGTGQPIIIKNIYIWETANSGVLQKANIDVVIFNNLATTTLGLSSNDVFALNTNNPASSCKVVNVSTYKDLGSSSAVGQAECNIMITPSQDEQNSISFALVSRGTPTYSDHTIVVGFDIEGA